jgi:hypothetical protein
VTCLWVYNDLDLEKFGWVVVPVDGQNFDHDALQTTSLGGR